VKIRWSSTAVLSALFAVLVLLLGALQWRWLFEIEGRDHFMRQQLVGRAAWLFKVTFDREVDALADALASAGPGGGERADRARGLAAGLDRWRAGSEWPGMVAAVYVLEPGDGGGEPTLLRLREAAGGSAAALVPVAWTPELRPLASAIARATEPPERQVIPGSLALVVPLSGGGSGAGPGTGAARAVAVPDEEALATRTFPDLVERFMPGDSFETTEVAVAEMASDRVLYSTHGVDRASEFGRADAVCGLVGWGGEPGSVGQYASTGPEMAWYRDLMDHVYFRGHWRVMVRYSDVPIPAEVAAAKRRKAAAGFGLLALLATSLVMLTAATRRAQRAARQQLEQLARVSHELRTPLTVLATAGDNLADHIVSGKEELEEYGRVIQRETRRLHELVENVLRLARRRAGVAPNEPVPVDLKALVEEVLATAEATLDGGGEGFTVERSLPPEGVPNEIKVMGDPRGLRSALLNLVSNAMKHGGSGRWLRIAVERRGRQARIEVADRGPGIGERDVARIFEPYVRGASTDGIEGSGLGLAVVRDVAEAHGGRVTVESPPGGGAIFVLRLPLAEDGP
jgi:signal transduction histidine kinase